MYCYSKDNQRLYSLVVEEKTIICFIQYIRCEGERPSREICTIKKIGEFDIKIFIKDMVFGGVRKWWKSRYESEINPFMSECERLNLEWVDALIDVKMDY